MDVSIIIINYNTYELTVACVASVIQFTNGLEYEIIVVDNASLHFDIEDLHKRFPGVHLIISEVNTGFAGGNNLGISQSKGEYILLLNSDIYLKNNAIHTTYQYLKNHPRVGVVSARLVYPDGRHQSVAQRFPSLKYSIIELLRLQKLMSKAAAGRMFLGAFFNHRENIRADWVWGAYFMFPRKVLGRLAGGQLDQSFFMYFEDMQWCMDIKKLGYEIHFCADAEVVHLMEGSSGKKNEMMYKNGLLFLEKNYNRWERYWIQKIGTLLKK